MARLIDDLLELSHRPRGPRSCARGSRADSAPDCRSADEVGSRTRRHVRRGGPRFRGSRSESIQIVLENLLGNAWQFTRKTATPRVEFGSVEQDPTPTFFVKDNGAGFDPAYASKLFAPFRRLHTEKEFPGTGVGLAIVWRIVDRHGGRVWADGAVGRGAAFWWTLPASRRENPS